MLAKEVFHAKQTANDVAYVAHAGAYKHPRSLPGIGVGESENSEDDESDVDEEVEES